MPLINSLYCSSIPIILICRVCVQGNGDIMGYIVDFCGIGAGCCWVIELGLF